MHNCIFLGEEPSYSRRKFLQGDRRVSVSVHGRYAVNHTGARLDAVLHHPGIGSLPYFTARHALQQGQIVQVLPEWEFKTNYCGEAWILYPPNRHLPPKLSAFINFMAERLSGEASLSRPHQIAGSTPSPYESPEVDK
ncbi:LysR substrate-binding domain-containing protein [Yersinia enterocolitica]